MEKKLDVPDFYLSSNSWMPDKLRQEIGQFNVFRRADFVGRKDKPFPYNRKDYYKVGLIIGRNRIHYADKIVDIGQPALFFANPQIPYSWEVLEPDQSGYGCIFTEAFFSRMGCLKSYPVFQPGGNPILPLTEEQAEQMQAFFLRMFDEIGSDYSYKYDVLRTLVLELIHSAQKLQPADTSLYSDDKAPNRVASLFIELLQRQFPIESPLQQMGFRAPAAFAGQLSVPVNHLNRAVKKITGKSTSELIANRILEEAVALLKNTEWHVSEIAWCLGFEHSTAFVQFFRKNLEVTPDSFRHIEG
jgi:AraC-like DNA-binding protein